jgi:hypothetical protein
VRGTRGREPDFRKALPGFGQAAFRLQPNYGRVGSLGGLDIEAAEVVVRKGLALWAASELRPGQVMIS